MIRDLATEVAPSQSPPDYDLCIIGSGPAGTTIARELSTSGLRIAVLESGRVRTSAHADQLRRVVSDDFEIKSWSRERVLGGTSTTWAGLSSPLDPIDFEPRPWLARPEGWPIPRESLVPYWTRAAERYRFPTLDDFGPTGIRRLRERGDFAPHFTDVDEKVFLAAAEPQNFGREWRSIYEGDAVDLWLDATVLRLETDRSTRSVTAAVVRASGGRELRFRARAFVLATGGIENARLLLVSNDLCDRGLGNEHDQVGRGFMNHPKNYRGVLTLARPAAFAPYFFGCLDRGFAGYGGLRLREEVQRRERLQNSYVRFEPLYPWSDNRGVEALVLLAKRSKVFVRSLGKKSSGEVVELRDYSETGDDSELQNERKTAGDWWKLLGLVLAHLPRVLQYAWFRVVTRRKPKLKRVRLRNFMEMEPDPENRVTLSDETDANGQPVPRVRWRVTDGDRRSLVALHRVLAAELSACGAGRLETDLADAQPWPIDQDASHHLGTTRMGVDPKTSVVDADLRLHGVANAFVAGGSVFPTSGCANPTFTIVALSIRLAEHLARFLKRGS